MNLLRVHEAFQRPTGSLLPILLLLSVQLATCVLISGQDVPLDPTSSPHEISLESSLHHALPEQYIWISGKTADGREFDRSAIRYFRDSFSIAKAPDFATLYIAGPNHVRAFLNGKLIVDGQQDPKSKISPFLITADVHGALKSGTNVIAVEASEFPDSFIIQFGGVLPTIAVKIVPEVAGKFAESLVVSDPGWKASFSLAPGWEQPGFDDSKWPQVQSLGTVEGDIDRFQWNADAGMYRWAGYDGISPFLAHLPVNPARIVTAFEGRGSFEHVSSLTPAVSQSVPDFSVQLPDNSAEASEFPVLVLDFGREINGRLEVASDSPSSMRVALQYGESLEEALHDPYLGTDPLTVPPLSIVYGPKSAFRYVRLKFLAGSSPLRFKSIRVDDIYYPVRYLGSFQSSDEQLNRIWEVGAYTAHLCMVDGIWDAPKRDRARWMGDLDVSGRVIDTVFADRFLMKETLSRLIAWAGNPVNKHVNTIPGYSAFWVMGLRDYYLHLGDEQFLAEMRAPLIQLLDFMATEFDQRGLFSNKNGAWPFVDWSDSFQGNTEEARAATQLEFYKAFVDGAWLLRQAGDATAAAKFQAQADQIAQAAQTHLLDRRTNTFGLRRQTNAMAIFSGVADTAQKEAIWQKVLSLPSPFFMSPYYNYYVISAMAQSGHRKEALDWIRQYWGGMVAQGATSFWEAYDLNWPKEDFHRQLRADDDHGYFVSLSHGWSSGPTAWLAEEILGIQPLESGFAKVLIRPDLAGLAWARGTEPTPHGPISVDCRAAGEFSVTVDLPAGVEAHISMPVSNKDSKVFVDGVPTSGSLAEQNTRTLVGLRGPGRFLLNSR